MSAKSRKRILIVEDTALVAMALEMEIEDRGHLPIGPAATVDAALAHVTETDIDAAILDVKLGDAEVFPVADTLMKASVPFIFYSGHIDRDRIKDRYDAPIYTKPVMPETIIDAVERLLLD